MEFVRIGTRKRLLDRAEIDIFLESDGLPKLSEWEVISVPLKIKKRNYLNTFSSRHRHEDNLLCVLDHASGKSEATMVRGFFADQKTETRS